MVTHTIKKIKLDAKNKLIIYSTFKYSRITYHVISKEKRLFFFWLNSDLASTGPLLEYNHFNTLEEAEKFAAKVIDRYNRMRTERANVGH